MSRNKKPSLIPAGQLWSVRVTREVRRPLDQTTVNLARDAILALGVELAYEEAERALKKAKRSKAKNRTERIGKAEAELKSLESWLKRFGSYS
jgi:hypothetical protein